ncbi:MotA/TolQ/ExbB proton channel family protein [Marinobacterium sediminicola]|uniref:Biopolymer transport protein ExbB n=1 Tax=Marinobacterium sediminicola TaxID=518898 RepID=A0ABY1RXA8_9GAMM|nr:MotA/TolQ/ExbB proton channel family protein [Marinobacterium sediminicola]ULG67843.1 MotA/TolQ/ExbB proton channel family protein [Marinobacterium sediminicola]SMR71475.1 biopolymer transport protein ExbB [Marinobacterium sediminicola]
MFEIIVAGGWLMLPIVACSIVALAICANRLLVLRPQLITPSGLLAEVWELTRSGHMTAERMGAIRAGSPLGRIIVSGLNNSRHGREIMKESIQEEASHVVHDLERFLNPLGTIAAITPLLGLLGTVIGMIKVFMEIMIQGTGNASILAGGISEALITTAAGLSVAIPALVMHRYFQRRIDSLVLTMEQESIKLVEAIHGDREVDIH